MGKEKYSVEQIITKLREVEVLSSQGRTVGEAVRQIGVSEQTYYRWRKQYGGMGTAEVGGSRSLRKKMLG